MSRPHHNINQNDLSFWHDLSLTLFIARCNGIDRDGIIHYVQWEAVSLALKWPRFGIIATNKAGISNHKKTWFLYKFFLSLKPAIIVIKIRHWALVQIYSLAEVVCCKASALAASALLTKTAINLHQCSASDLNPYNNINVLCYFLGYFLSWLLELWLNFLFCFWVFNNFRHCLRLTIRLNPYVAGGKYGQYKMIQKTWKKLLKPWQMGTHLRVLSESYPMNTNMTGFRWFSKSLHPCSLDEVASALEGLRWVGTCHETSHHWLVHIQIKLHLDTVHTH